MEILVHSSTGMLWTWLFQVKLPDNKIAIKKEAVSGTKLITPSLYPPLNLMSFKDDKV